jgi:hypothetical protein
MPFNKKIQIVAMSTPAYKYEKCDVREYERESNTQLGFITSVFHLLSGSWMRSGDEGTDDIRSQMLTEQTSISLVAALFTTVGIAQMFVCDGWEDDWKKGVYGLVINLANVGLVSSVLVSIIYILAINECTNNSELIRFRRHMGVLMELPFLCFVFGAVMFGAITLAFWCYRTFELEW